MKPICKMLALAIAFAACVQTLAAAESAAPESARTFLLRMQEEATAPIIEHCNASVPEQKTFLDAEYAIFKSRFRAASAGLLEHGVDSAELSKPVDPELAANLTTVQAQMLAQVKKLDPRTYCTQLRTNLANQTVDTIRTALETAFRQYTSHEDARQP